MSLHGLHPTDRNALVTVVAIAVIAGIAALVALFTPTEAVGARTVGYSHSGRISYHAMLPRNPAYPDGRLRTGDPIFLQVARKIDVAFHYEMTAQAPVNTAGSAVIFAELSDGAGWSRRIVVVPPTKFSGQPFELKGRLDLRKLQRTIDRVQDVTGVPNTTYTVELGADVHLQGDIGGQTFSDDLTSVYKFQIDPYRMQPEASEETSSAVGPSRVSQEGSVEVVAPVRNTFPILGIPISTARIGSALLLLLCALAAAVIFARASRRQAIDEPARIEARFGKWMVEVSKIEVPPTHRLICVKDFEAIALLAETYERMIMHSRSDGTHSYVVDDGNAAYYYEASDLDRLAGNTEEAATTIASGIDDRVTQLAPRLQRAMSKDR